MRIFRIILITLSVAQLAGMAVLVFLFGRNYPQIAFSEIISTVIVDSLSGLLILTVLWAVYLFFNRRKHLKKQPEPLDENIGSSES